MSTWTHNALQTLEGYLKNNRARFASAGADPDEVEADLRRHVEEEVAAMELPVVTEADVHRIVARLGPAPSEDLEHPNTKSNLERERREKSKPGLLLLLLGVIWPAVTLGFEWITHLCSGMLFDPLPTWLHLVLCALVPIGNLLAWVALRWPEGCAIHRLWRMNGIIFGVALFYSLIFLPVSIFAVMGIAYFGIGLLPLTPFVALGAAWEYRGLLRKHLNGDRIAVPRGWAWAALAPVIILGVYASIEPITRHWIAQAGSESPNESIQAVQWLRRWGSKQAILKESYGRANQFWKWLFNVEGPNSDLAQKVFYRVTGKPYNAVPPPLNRFQQAGREVLNDFEWDEGLGGDTVAGQVRGLSLAQSRLDGICQPDEGWAYLEWILEFKNEHPSRQREARAQIALPPGGVVSRVTLWVNGEEREAAFAGRSQVREAYQQVAVQERRDPVLVTTSGPDRVLVQCFPIQPKGGTMKVRLGITAPLIVENEHQEALKLPCLAERNFAIRDQLEHSIWLESPLAPESNSIRFVSDQSQEGKHGTRGLLSDAELGSPDTILRFACSDSIKSLRVRDTMSVNGSVIHQVLERIPAKMPGRIAIVLDGSENMTEFLPQIARAFDGLPAPPEMAVWFVKDGVEQIFNTAWQSRETVSGVVGKLRGVGGQDDVPALLLAWEWAVAKQDSTILWIHGPQPVLMDNLEILQQRLEWRSSGSNPVIVDIPMRPGANRLIEKLGAVNGITSLPRLGNLASDLEHLFSEWTGRQPQFRWVRSLEAGSEADKEVIAKSATSHLGRLLALDRIQALIRARRYDEAVRMAGLYQLVTPISGAVVLETARQFQRAGLTPASPVTVPTVPEPGTWALLTLGACFFLAMRITRKLKKSKEAL